MLAIVIFLVILRIDELEKRIASLGNNQGKHEFELAESMGHLQRFADKLYFSGSNENWDLAAFYLHEMHEQAEGISKANLREDGVEITPLVDSFLEGQLDLLKGTVTRKDRGAFSTHYGSLVASCNACHDATAHGFIKIAILDSIFPSSRENQSTSGSLHPRVGATLTSGC